MGKRGKWVKREEETARCLVDLRITKKFRGNCCPDIRILGQENLRNDLKNASKFRHHRLFLGIAHTETSSPFHLHVGRGRSWQDGPLVGRGSV